MEVRVIDHTADVGIEVEAESLEELFEGTAYGMFSLMLDPSCQVGHTVKRDISIDAEDPEELMFEWLNELIYLFDAEEFLLSSCEVKRIEGIKEARGSPSFQGDTLKLAASVEGERYDPRKHTIGIELKAATYHQLRLERRGAFWYSRIIFDV
ncbi:MAG: archease [Actinomycetota bacterium]|nr:archease [Actinomycetota bacterium]